MSYSLIKHTEFSAGTPESVWNLWSDVSKWKDWDHGVQSCTMQKGHHFEKGGEALFHPQGAPEPVVIRITECRPNKGFKDVTELPFGKLIFEHKIVACTGGVNITHEAKFEPVNEQMKGIFEKAVGDNIRKGLPESVKAIARLAEESLKKSSKKRALQEGEEKKGKEAKQTHYWLNVVSLEHVQWGVRDGITQSCHGKDGPLKRIQKGDWIVHYSPKTSMESKEKCQKFTSIGKVPDDNVYQHDMGGGFKPFRRKVEYLKATATPIEPLLEKLSFSKGNNNWGMVMRRGLIEITEEDFNLIRERMKAKAV